LIKRAGRKRAACPYPEGRFRPTSIGLFATRRADGDGQSTIGYLDNRVDEEVARDEEQRKGIEQGADG